MFRLFVVFISGELTKPTRTSIITLVGERDSDRTALMANWPKRFHAGHQGGSKVITHFVVSKVITHSVGSSALGVDITIFLRGVTYELRGEYVGECRL